MSSSRNTPPNGRRFVPCVEGLEDRTVPSGNVRVMLFDGTLYVAGDDADNQVWIQGNGNGGATVRALDATTTLNGGTGPVSVDHIKHDVYVRLFGGNDNLLVTDMRNNGTLDVDTGDGNDIVGVSDAGNRAATILNTGNGNDTVILNGSVFRRYVFINTGAGNDQVIAASVGAVDFGILNPSGNDFFDNRGSTFARPVTMGVTAGMAPAPDTTPPTATVTSAATATNTAPIAFTVGFSEVVTGFDASDLNVTNGTVASVNPTDAQTFTVQVTPTGQGPVTVTAVAGGATDAAGNGNLVSNTATVTFDTTAPALAIDPLTTNDTTPTLTGTVNDPTAVVQVTVNGHTYTATVTNGTWSAAVTDSISDGTFPITATATDPAGNVGTATPVSLKVDSTAPSVATFDLASASDSGTVGDFRTDVSSVTLHGTTEAGATVLLYTVTAPGTPGSGTPLMQTTALSDGTFSFTGVTLNVGPNSFAVRAVDSVGNAGATFAQTFTRNTAPTVANPIAAQNASAGGAALTFDLTNTFADAERVAQLTVAYPTGQTGVIDVNLFGTQAPATVTNFLSYANNSDPTKSYDNSVFHRLATGFVLQGGGFKFNDAGTTTATAFPPIVKSPPVANEPGISNTRGTIAMAKSPGDPNSATDEFFFNLADNSSGSSSLDSQNGGFTVFGQVMHGGQQVVDAIAGLSTFSGAGIPGAPPFPVSGTANTTNFPANISASDVATVTSVRELGAVDRMAFTIVGNTTPAVATPTINATNGMLSVQPGSVGSTTITVRATDLDGSFTDTQIVVNVT